jgi:hypothetical protein
MDPISSAHGILSAMITPALLISACGTLILSTSSYLGRVVDRIHDWPEQFEAVMGAEGAEVQERRAILVTVGKARSRSSQASLHRDGGYRLAILGACKVSGLWGDARPDLASCDRQSPPGTPPHASP